MVRQQVPHFWGFYAVTNIHHLNEQLEIEGYQAYCLVALLKFNDIVWGATMDYLYCRTDDPRGKLYEYKPQALKEKTEQSREMREFIEMCFDPKAPVNQRLKEALLRIMTEEAKEE